VAQASAVPTTTGVVERLNVRGRAAMIHVETLAFFVAPLPALWGDWIDVELSGTVIELPP
jgi:hypothetical protein